MEPSIRDRWWSAVCYLFILVLIPLFLPNKGEFLARHCRQGFALFFAEVVVIILVNLIESTIGRIPVLGLVISIVLHLVAFLIFLVVSVLGFFKALSGEEWRIPYLDEVAEKIPVQSSE